MALFDGPTENKRTLFEGAQGVMLDIDHGTYPFVTKQYRGRAAATGVIGPTDIGFVLGITKPIQRELAVARFNWRFWC